MKRTREIADIQLDMERTMDTYRALVLELELERLKLPLDAVVAHESASADNEDLFSSTEEGGGDGLDRPRQRASRVCGACNKTFNPSPGHKGTKCSACKKRHTREAKRMKQVLHLRMSQDIS